MTESSNGCPLPEIPSKPPEMPCAGISHEKLLEHHNQAIDDLKAAERRVEVLVVFDPSFPSAFAGLKEARSSYDRAYAELSAYYDGLLGYLDEQRLAVDIPKS